MQNPHTTRDGAIAVAAIYAGLGIAAATSPAWMPKAEQMLQRMAAAPRTLPTPAPPAGPKPVQQ